MKCSVFGHKGNTKYFERNNPITLNLIRFFYCLKISNLYFVPKNKTKKIQNSEMTYKIKKIQR